eukprot:7768552-Lingulodinium_polyedra.AAC.1
MAAPILAWRIEGLRAANADSRQTPALHTAQPAAPTARRWAGGPQPNLRHARCNGLAGDRKRPSG